MLGHLLLSKKSGEKGLSYLFSYKKFIYLIVLSTRMGIAKVTTNYQVTIPKDIRRIHGIKIGDTVLFAVEGDKIHFMNMDREKILTEISGSWKNEITGSSTAYVKKLRSGWSKRTKRLGI